MEELDTLIQFLKHIEFSNDPFVSKLDIREKSWPVLADNTTVVICLADPNIV